MEKLIETLLDELKDAFENLGASIIKEVCTKTNDVAGDGTTTASVLAGAILNEGLKNLTAGANPILLRDGITQAINLCVKHLKEISFGNFYGIKADNEYFLAVEEILVDKENPYYSSVNGVLFDKKQETLLFYPELKKEKEYEVPDLVKVIEFMDFSNTKLQSVKIGKNVREIRAVFDKNTVIKGYENSYAQKWANENGYEFSIL